jgi:hypothetical protein
LLCRPIFDRELGEMVPPTLETGKSRVTADGPEAEMLEGPRRAR